MSYTADTTVTILSYAASNVEGTTSAAASAPVEETGTDSPRSTRPRALPNRLANLEGANERFLVIGEKWVGNPTPANKRPKKQPTTQSNPVPSARPILPAPDSKIQDVSPVRQVEEASLIPHNAPLDCGPSIGTFHFSTHIQDALDSGSAISLATYAQIETYMPPPNQSSNGTVPRDLARVQTRPCQRHFCAQPHNHYRPQEVVSQVPAATPDLSFEPYPASQLPVLRPSANVPQMTSSDSYQMDWETSANAVDAHSVHLMAQLDSGSVDAGALGSQPHLQPIWEAWDDFVRSSRANTGER